MKYRKAFTSFVYIAVVVAAALVVVSPLFRKGFFVSDDGEWMIIRLTAFYQSFRDGQFPVRFLSRLNYSFGYPVANFLYPGFLYIGSVIHFLGFSFIDSIKVILGGSVLFSSVFVFLWLRVYFSAFASMVGALGYVFAPYVTYDLYTRGSVGEVLAFSWAAMGLYSIASRKSWLFTPAVFLLILSHNSLALMFLAVFVAYLLVTRPGKSFLYMFLAGIGMATFFWFPALHDRKYVVFDETVIANSWNYFVTDSRSYLLGFAGILAAVVAVGIPKLYRKEKAFFLSVFCVCLFLVVPLSKMFWVSPLTQFIQFPFRFLSVLIFIAAWIISYSMDAMKKSSMVIILSLIYAGICFMGIFGPLAQVHFIDYPDGYYSTNEGTTTVHDEYMPRWVMDKPSSRENERIIFVEGQGVFTNERIDTQSLDVDVLAAQDSIVQLNMVYFPGWGAAIDGNKVELNYKNNKGVMRIMVPAGKHHIQAAFRETISRFIADIASLGFFVWYAVMLVHKKSAKGRST